jgi:hypothetical protein
VDNSGCGTIFKIGTAGRFSVQFTFAPEIVHNPVYNALSLDSQGNIYGSAMYSGTNNTGVVFELDTNGDFADLLDFPRYDSDGGYFANNIIRGKYGDLYGTMQDGGETGCGAQLAGGRQSQPVARL